MDTDTDTAIKLARAVKQLGYSCERRECSLVISYPEAAAYISDKYRSDLVVTVCGGRFFGPPKFWSANALLLYLINPLASFRVCAMDIIRQTRQYIADNKKVISIAETTRAANVVYLSRGRSVVLYDCYGWYNCCYIVFMPSRKMQLIDRIIAIADMEELIDKYCI